MIVKQPQRCKVHDRGATEVLRPGMWNANKIPLGGALSQLWSHDTVHGQHEEKRGCMRTMQTVQKS